MIILATPAAIAHVNKKDFIIESSADLIKLAKTTTGEKTRADVFVNIGAIVTDTFTLHTINILQYKFYTNLLLALLLKEKNKTKVLFIKDGSAVTEDLTLGSESALELEKSIYIWLSHNEGTSFLITILNLQNSLRRRISTRYLKLHAELKLEDNPDIFNDSNYQNLIDKVWNKAINLKFDIV